MPRTHRLHEIDRPRTSARPAPALTVRFASSTLAEIRIETEEVEAGGAVGPRAGASWWARWVARWRLAFRPYPIALPGGLRIRFESGSAEVEAHRRAAEARTRRRLERFAPP